MEEPNEVIGNNKTLINHQQQSLKLEINYNRI